MAERELLAEIRDLMIEVRDEHRLNRAASAQQTELLSGVVERNAEAFVQIADSLNQFGERTETAFNEFGARIDSFGERIDAFGATLDIQREILLRFLDRLDEREPPQG